MVLFIGMQCLFRFYSYGLENRFRADLFDAFQKDVVNDLERSKSLCTVCVLACLPFLRASSYADVVQTGWRRCLLCATTAPPASPCPSDQSSTVTSSNSRYSGSVMMTLATLFMGMLFSLSKSFGARR